MSDRPLRCAVIGVGRMGAHHARIYAETDGAELVAVVDPDPARRTFASEKWGAEPVPTIEILLEKGIDAVSIAAPTRHHRALAETLLKANIACLIEKPLAPDETEAQAIAHAAALSDAVLQVGHIVRYDPVTRAVCQLSDLNPRFIEMDRVSPMTFRSVDVGVVLDMMIHDIDVLLMLMGAEPQEIQANAVCVFGEAEDVCNARLTFPPGSDGISCVANVTASRLALKTERKMRIISEASYVSADFVKGSGMIVRKTANDEQLTGIRRRLEAGEDLSQLDYLGLVQVEPLAVEDGEPLRLQIDDFLTAVRGGKRPTVDVHAGFAAVRTANRIVSVARQSGSKMI